MKHTETGNFMIAGDYEAHPTGPTGGVKFVAETESDDQVFLVETEGTSYKLKTKSGKYIYCQAWNVDALDEASALTFRDNGDGTFKLKCDKGYFKVEFVGDAYYPFCDAALGAAANFELVEVVATTPEVPATPLAVESVYPDFTVRELSEITVNFNAEITGQFDPYSMTAMKFKKGNSVAAGVDSWTVEGNKLTVTLSQTVTEAGEYTLVIPEGLITRKSDGAAYSGELTFTLEEEPVVVPEVTEAELKLTFVREGDNITVNVAGLEGVTASIVGKSHDYKDLNVANANTIICPNVNGNTNPTITYALQLNGVPANLNLKGMALDIHALNGGGSYQDNKDAKNRQWNVVVAQGETTVANFADIEISQGEEEGRSSSNNHKVHAVEVAEGPAATDPMTFNFTITKGTTNDGCFFGLSEVTLNYGSDATVDPEQPEVPNAELAETYNGKVSMNFFGSAYDLNTMIVFGKDENGAAKEGYATLKIWDYENFGMEIAECVPYEVNGNTVVLKGVTVGAGDGSINTKNVDLTFTVQEDGTMTCQDKVYGPTPDTSIIQFDFSAGVFAPETTTPEVPEVPAGPVVITDVAQLSNAKCYTLVSSDTGRGGMYALADKVDMCGVTYNAGTDACHSVALDNADPKQQFAFVAYEGKLYLYSVSEKKFVMKSGDTNALVGEAPFEHVVVEKVGENTFALQANGTHYFTASPGWCANPERGTCIQSTLDSHSSDNGWDNGAWYTITEVADFDATEALAMLAPATETPEALELLSVDPADGSELESVNKFTFTFNKPVTIGEEGGVTLSANGGTTTLEVIASDEETSVVTFTTGKEITVSGDYELKVAAGTFVDADGNTNEAMTFKYTVVSTANTLTLVSTNPSTDEVQTSLKRITLTFSEEVYYFDDVTINVTDEGGNVVTTGILYYGLNYEDMDVVLNDAIVTPGKYTVTIPENCMFGNGNYNPEIVLTYTIGSEEPEEPEEQYNTFVPTKITPAEGLVESLKEIVLDFGPNDYPGTNGLDMNSTFNLTNAAGDVVATGKLSYSGWTAAAVTLDKEIVEPGVYTIIIPEGSIWNSKVNGTADKGVSNGARCNPTLELTYEIKAATSVVAVDPACGHYEVMPATIKVTFSQEISAITYSRVRTDVANDAYTLQATDMNINGKELTFTVPAEYVTEARNMLIMLSVVDANGNSVSYASNKETEIEGYVMLEYTADGITGINGITVEQLNDVYTLDGRKVVLTPGQKIKKGLYIVGGKKVYVK